MNMCMHRHVVALGAVVAGLTSIAVSADVAPFSLEFEAGSTWQNKNKVQIPNDNEGTRFSLEDLVGNGPWATGRINALWNVNEKHAVRVVLAPFSYDESGVTEEIIEFDGQRFEADTETDARYRFSSWRVGYRYQFYEQGPWDLWVGATAKIRDAEVRLRQGAVSASDSDIGFVPLLHFAARYQFDQSWYFAFDFDGLAGGPGRAIDLAMKLGYQVGDQWDVQLGYRTLEGGADTDDVYNFAWFNSALLGLQYRF